ncbi:recombinase family protein, partial [Paenibacillus alvei]
TTEQDINAQLELCKQYADEHGYKPELVFKDHGLSANDVRPELGKMKEYIKANHGKTLIVKSFDRLYRDLTKMNEFVQFAKNANYNVVSANANDRSLKELEFICGIDKIRKEQEASE